MEDIILSRNEHKLLLQHKRKLEYHFGVQINLPEVSNSNSCNDIIVGSICGEIKKRNYVKKFLQMKLDKLLQRQAQSSAVESSIPVITLSESDSDNTVLAETQNRTKKWKRKRKARLANKQVKHHKPSTSSSPSKQENKNAYQVASNLSDSKFEEGSLPSTVECQSAVNVPIKITAKDICNSAVVLFDNNPQRMSPSISIAQNLHTKEGSLPSTVECQTAANVSNKIDTEDMDDSVVILSDDNNLQTMGPLISIAQNLPAESKSDGASDTPLTDDSIIILSDIHMPSTSNHKKVIPKQSISKSFDDHEVSFHPAPEFLHLKTSKYAIKEDNLKRKETLITLENQIPQPIVNERRVFRPIVIDGSNVAREHGKVQNTFSCKGIKLSIEYFLKRGHTQVTAFVPHFRKYCNHTYVPTTDQDILIELEKTQNVVFTPSRRLNGKMMSCYDDRFIVDLASKIGGVILSNDNYRDIMDESPRFKKTIEERLLMYCFVGDIIMIPEDPLGRYGPKLDEFLSMKESNDETQSSSYSNVQWQRV